MKALFVHDHVFIKNSIGDIYSPGGFPRDLWSKYTDNFDELNVLARGEVVLNDNEGKHVLSALHSDNMKFIFAKPISSLANLLSNYNETYNLIKKHVAYSDVVVARLPSENGLIAIDIANKLGKKCIVEVVGCVWDGLWNYGNITGKIYAPFAFFRMRKAVKKSSSVLYVTNHFLQGRYPKNNNSLTVSASNVNINYDMTIDVSKEMSDKVTIGLIGNYKTNYKGIDTALEAIVKLKEKEVDFELRVLGNGEPSIYKKFIDENRLESNVRFYQPLPSGKPVLDWLDDIDIYIQPSRQEGLPRALIEAMSRGCLCIGSQAGGIPELLISDYVHKTGSSVDLFQKIYDCSKMSVEDANLIRIRNHQESSKYTYDYINKIRSNFFKDAIK